MTPPEFDPRSLKREFIDKRLRTHEGAVLDAVAHMLWEFDSAHSMLRVATRFAAQHLGACRADFGFGLASAAIYKPEVEWLDQSVEAPSMSLVELPNRDEVVQRVWRSATPVAYEDCYKQANVASLREGFRATRLRSMIARRLEHQGQAFGILCIDQTTHPRRWKDRDYDFVESFCAEFLAPLLVLANQAAGGQRPTAAELDAIRLAAQGLSYKQIAARLNKSVRTVEHQLRNARQRLNAANQADLVLKCQRWL